MRRCRSARRARRARTLLFPPPARRPVRSAGLAAPLLARAPPRGGPTHPPRPARARVPIGPREASEEPKEPLTERSLEPSGRVGRPEAASSVSPVSSENEGAAASLPRIRPSPPDDEASFSQRLQA